MVKIKIYDANGLLQPVSTGGGGGGAPGGAAGNVQYNDGAGGFAGEAPFTYSAATDQLTVPGLGVSQDFALTGDIADNPIVSTNDYAPAGLATATVLRLTTNTINITGLTGGSDGRIIIIMNVGANTCTLKANDAASAAANRFGMANDHALHASDACVLQYESTSSLWRLIASGTPSFDVAPTTPTYITVTNSAFLANERALAVGAALTLVDGGAGASITIDRAAITGDVTIPAGSNVATIPADSVDFTKTKNINTDKILGRDTAGTGDIEELDATGGLEFTGAGGIRTSAFTGDATKAAGGTAMTVVSAAGAFALLGDGANSTTGTENNVVITGLSVVYYTGGAVSTKTGFAGGTDGRILAVVNVAASALTLADESASSTDINRLALLANIVLATDEGALLIYRDTGTSAARWRCLSRFSTGGGGLSDADYTDITVSGGGTVMTIDPRAVTFAKIQAINTLRILGRSSVGSGDIEEHTLDPGLTISGGVISVTGASGAFSLYGDTASGTTGSSNNVAIVGAAVIYYTGAGTATWTGIAGGSDGRIIIIVNRAGAGNTLTLTDDDAASTNVNRMDLNGSIVLDDDEGCVLIWYDAGTTASRWRCFGRYSASASGASAAEAYVTIGNTGGLSAERALAVTAALTLTDGGANASVTLDRAALTGDVTAPAGSNATTVANCELSAVDITGATAETITNPWDDYIALYDGSATANRKVRWYDAFTKNSRWLVRVSSDCWATAGNEGIQATNSGTGASVNLGNGTASHPGVLASDTGTTTTGRNGLASSPTAVILGGGRARFMVIINVPTLSAVAQEFIVRWGIGDDVTAEPTDGVYFRYNRLASVNFIGVCRSGGAETTVTGGAVNAAQWYRLEAEINAGATSVEFFIDGSSIGTVSATIPTAATGLMPQAIIKSAGSLSRTAEIDMWDFIFELTTPR